jgi:hypothetical protein
VSIAAISILSAAPAFGAVPAAAEEPAGAVAPAAPPEAAAAVSAAPPEAAAAVSAAAADKPSPAINKFKVTLFGFAELDMMRDSTQFLTEAPGNGIVRGNTDVTKFAGTHERTMFSVKNSRVGLKLGAPEVGGVKSSGFFEADFFGNQPLAYSDAIVPINEPPNMVNNRIPTAVNETSSNINASVRLRHYYLKFETPVVDVLAGQYFDVFGWGGGPFFPSTVSLLGVVGELFHRQPQLRLSHRFRSEAVDFEIAAAAARPVQRDGGYPDAEGGMRVFFNQWRGVHSQSSGQPVSDPLCVGVSGLFREFRLNEFTALPPTQYINERGWGVAAQAMIPIIRGTLDDQRNALSLTAEFNMTSGASDFYTNLTGGDTTPSITDGAGNNVPYAANLDPGIVDWSNAYQAFVPIKWQGILVGLQYHLPIDEGKIWVSALYAQLSSSNISEVALKPYNAYKKSEYFDGSAFIAFAASTQIGVMYQTMKDTYVDDSDVSLKSARNHRVHVAFLFFF